MGLAAIGTKQSLADHAYDQLITSVLNGDLRSGEHLVMDRLAAQLGISRTPVRDALARLERDGLVESANRGYVIRTVDDADIASIYEARVAVEVFAVRHVAMADDATKAQVRKAIDAADDLDASSPALSFAANRSVHRAIVEATGNPVLVNCFDTIWNTSVVAYAFAELHRSAAVHAGIKVAHKALLDAIEAGDPDIAEAEMLRHLNDGQNRSGY